MAFWFWYVSAWILILLYMQLARRGVAGVRGEVRTAMTSAGVKILLVTIDFLVLIAAFSLAAAPFFVFQLWWIAAIAFAATFVGTSLAAGILTGSLVRSIDAPEAYHKYGIIAGLITLALCAAFWWTTADMEAWI